MVEAKVKKISAKDAAHDAKESKVTHKAGLIPYIWEGDVLLLMFMTSSNPKFGGSRPMISKGSVEKDESPEETAIREAEEELGLKRSNLAEKPILSWRDRQTGLKGSYEMTVYAVEVKSKSDFGKSHYETGRVMWMTPKEFGRKGRTAQREIVRETIKKIRKK